MKITKLLTLSQFIDSCEGSSESCYYAIVKYNNFLKQPITKEMFVGDDAIFDGWKSEPTELIRDITTLSEFANDFNGETLKNVDI
jgi:hypothetical protein